MNERIRQSIRQEMDRQNVTQAELARKLDVKPPSLSQVLSGKRGLMPESLMDVLDALGLELVAQRKGKS